MNVTVRSYQPEDYAQLVALYKQSQLYGGQFDADRDSEERLSRIAERSPDSILVAERDGQVIGTVSLLKDGRTAWLFRFAVMKDKDEAHITSALYAQAVRILKSQGHNQVLVYAPADDENFAERYNKLGFNKGGNYTCYWQAF